MLTNHRSLTALLLLALASAPCAAQAPLGSAFTYQGELASAGSPATGTYDIRFRLYDAASGGNQIGSTLCSDNLAVTAGRFAATLDFGAAAFSGQQRFLEIEVRQDSGLDCSDATGYTVLTPRQELTAAPNASFALNAATASTATTAGNATSLNGQSPSFYQNAANLTGTLADTQLSSNVARLDGNQTFTGQTSFSNPANTFSGIFAGNGAGLLNLSGANIAAGTITRSRMGADVESVLSQWTSVPQPAAPRDAIAWGYNNFGQTTVPALPSGVTYTAVAGGTFHNLALRSDGAVVAWGYNNFGQTNVPALPSGVTYTAVAGGFYHSLALRSDGTVVAWGLNNYGQTTVPALPSGVTYTAVAGGEGHSLALRSDGTVVAWGRNNNGQRDVPALPSGVTYTAVAGGLFHSLALRSDGTVVAWGNNSDGQTNVPALPSGVTYTAVAGGFYHSLALRSDGTVVAWGYNGQGQRNVPALPSGVTYTAVAGGQVHSLALRSDGTVVAWGYNNNGQTNVPALPSGVMYTAVAGGGGHSLALRGTVSPPRLSSPSAVAASSFVGSGAALTNLNAANLTGTLEADRIPSLDASKITSGALGTARIPDLDASKITTGTFAAARIPSLDASIITAGTLANGRTTGTNLNTASTLVLRDASGNFSAGTITAALNGSATQLNGQPASFYTNAANIAAGTLDNARTTGTNLNTPNTLVLRDASGNFSAGTITAALNGNATSATNATQLNGQAATFYTNASNINTGTLANARTTGTNLNTASTLVLRDASGNFSAGTITANLSGNATSATTATNSTQLNGQPASFYTNASNLTSGTISPAVLPASSWTAASLPPNILNPTTYTTILGTSQTLPMRAGVAVVNWSVSGYSTANNTGFGVRVRAGSNTGPVTVFYFNLGAHAIISGNAIIPIPTAGNYPFSLEIIRLSGGGNFASDSNDSLTATIINLGQ
jgi:hypothetical protein